MSWLTDTIGKVREFESQFLEKSVEIPLSNCWICQAGQLFGDCGKTSHVLRGRERNKLNKH